MLVVAESEIVEEIVRLKQAEESEMDGIAQFIALFRSDGRLAPHHSLIFKRSFARVSAWLTDRREADLLACVRTDPSEYQLVFSYWDRCDPL